MSQPSLPNLLNESWDDIQKYLFTQVDYLKLEGTEKLVKITALIVSAIVLVVFSAGLIFFLGLALAVYLGEAFNSMPAGFFVVFFAYLLIGFVVLRFRRYTITNPILRLVIKALYLPDTKNPSDPAK